MVIVASNPGVVEIVIAQVEFHQAVRLFVVLPMPDDVRGRLRLDSRYGQGEQQCEKVSPDACHLYLFDTNFQKTGIREGILRLKWTKAN